MAECIALRWRWNCFDGSHPRIPSLKAALSVEALCCELSLWTMKSAVRKSSGSKWWIRARRRWSEDEKLKVVLESLGPL